MGDYPTNDELKKIRKWKLHDNLDDLLELIKPLFNKWGFYHSQRIVTQKITKLQLSTGGWSGNESIIEALKKSEFWFYWEESRRGGHYKFEIPFKL